MELGRFLFEVFFQSDFKKNLLFNFWKIDENSRIKSRLQAAMIAGYGLKIRPLYIYYNDQLYSS